MASGTELFALSDAPAEGKILLVEGDGSLLQALCAPLLMTGGQLAKVTDDRYGYSSTNNADLTFKDGVVPLNQLGNLRRSINRLPNSAFADRDAQSLLCGDCYRNDKTLYRFDLSGMSLQSKQSVVKKRTVKGYSCCKVPVNEVDKSKIHAKVSPDCKHQLRHNSSECMLSNGTCIGQSVTVIDVEEEYTVEEWAEVKIFASDAVFTITEALDVFLSSSVKSLSAVSELISARNKSSGNTALATTLAMLHANEVKAPRYRFSVFYKALVLGIPDILSVSFGALVKEAHGKKAREEEVKIKEMKEKEELVMFQQFKEQKMKLAEAVIVNYNVVTTAMAAAVEEQCIKEKTAKKEDIVVVEADAAAVEEPTTPDAAPISATESGNCGEDFEKIEKIEE